MEKYNIIDVQKINFAYDKKKVLDNVTCNVKKGDLCAVMGLNGSGKSTLLKLIAKLLTFSQGNIIVDERPLSSYKTRTLARKIAYVPQQQEIVFDFSVYDTVMMGRNPYQHRWESENDTDRAIVEEVLSQCNLSHLKERMLTQLSGGEMQRALIARAMAQKAPVMLLDEPLSNLDVVHKYEIMDILKGLNHNRQTTILIILHDFSFAKQYANKTLLLKEGTLHHFGFTDSILTSDIIKETFNLSGDYRIDDLGNIVKNHIFASKK